MLLIDLSQFKSLPYTNPYEPFVYVALLVDKQLPAFWTDTFGAPDNQQTEVIQVNQLVRTAENNYTEHDSLAACLADEQSFFFDTDTQKIYVHYEHDQSNYTDEYEYARVRGFSQDHLIYLDDIIYEPLILSVPSIAQQQDIIGQDKLSFINGSIVLNTADGRLDDLIDTPVYGNLLYLKWLEKTQDVIDYDSATADITELAALYVEDYDFTLSEIDLRVQDMRKSQNIDIPVDVFDSTTYPNIKDTYIDKPIPVLYGSVRATKPIPIDGEGTGSITFKQAVTLTSLGTVYTENDDGDWIARTPSSTDVSAGQFTLAEADGRKTSGDPRNCRVEGSVGIAVTYASDVIKDMNERFIDIEYNDSNYDTTEWETEETYLGAVGLYLDKQIKLFDAIRLIQQGANLGFRYEILPDGRRTIRVNRWDRERIAYISKEEIENIDELPVETDSELLAAKIKIDYSKDYAEDEYLSVIDTSQRVTVLGKYRQQPQQEFETLLPTETLADARAAWDAVRLADIRGIFSPVLMRKDFLSLRIYDMIEIEVTPGVVGLGAIQGRPYFGVWRAQIISIDPNTRIGTNGITVLLVEKLDQVEYEIGLRITADDIVRGTADGDTRIYFIEG